MKTHEGLLILLACSLVFRSSTGAAMGGGSFRGTSSFREDDLPPEDQQQVMWLVDTADAEASNSSTGTTNTVDAATSTTEDAQEDTPAVESGMQGTESAEEPAPGPMSPVNYLLSSRTYLAALNTAAHFDPFVFLGLLLVPLAVEQYALMQRRSRAQRLDQLLGTAPKGDRNKGARGDSSK